MKNVFDKKRYRDIYADREALAKTFPKAFAPPRSAAEKQPLKLGIIDDLKGATVLDAEGQPLSASRKKRALSDYCRGPKYQRAVIRAGAIRVDLEGYPVDRVLEGHRQHAEAILAGIEEERQRRRVANQQRAEAIAGLQASA